MHIALISARFMPEASPGAKRVTDLVASLQAAGHRTTVLTQLPNYPDPGAFAAFPCDEGPVTIRRDPAGNELWRFRPRLAAKGNLPARLVAEGLFAHRASRRETRLSGFDAVFATSPYIFSLWAASTYRVPMWLDLRDLTWDNARELGARNLLRTLGSQMLKSLALRTFRAAVRISTTTARQRRYLIEHGIAPQRVVVVPNGVPKRIVDDLTPPAKSTREDRPLQVVYAGLLGFPQGLAFAVESMESLPATQVELHLYGDGVDQPSLLEYCQSRHLPHIHVHGHVPYEQYLAALRSADILYASLRPAESLAAAMPSKIWEYMAAGKPVLFAGEGEAAEAIQQAGAGLSVRYGDRQDFQAKLHRLLADEAYRRKCGENGRSWVLDHQIREEINAAWVEAMARVCGAGPHAKDVRGHEGTGATRPGSEESYPRLGDDHPWQT
jgi:glycosyltransferase involved in cell wall biosynthesis